MDETVNTEYFESYEDLEIHRLMLEDASRTATYKQAILSNAPYFKDKVVMDVGCGTGILSIFCAQAGAKKVYAVEASKLANLAKEVVKENNFETIIEVIHSKVEDVTLPDNIKVDAIVSEWMGFYLLHEGMLDSVLVARDQFLKEDGHLFPESATIYVAPCSVPSLYKQWDNVHGVSMSAFSKQLRQSKYNKPEIIQIHPEDLLGPEIALCWIDLKENKSADLDSFSLQHVLGASRAGAYQGISVWFDCVFPDLSQDREESQMILGTGPFSLPTHWKQTVIVLPQEQLLEPGEPIAFQLDMTRDSSNCRRYNLQVTLQDPEVVEHPTPCTCHMTKCIIIKTFMHQHPEQPRGGEKNSDERREQQPILVDEPIDDDEDE
ncbi:hypothetical protein JYU34_014350 [Plutella xylostella]|uniref:Protein arginine N-methyltransferase domain-containing protein n=1 Tax=Plutella xylostella TaxID=51655 RepID=A0ABQ7Q839_PLUXY|nr:hypothetical protein JYU34_014350 [Plutella xylostella]